METDVIKFQPKEETPRGSNWLRGREYNMAARAFVLSNPAGSILEPSTLDRALAELGMLVIPVEGTAKSDDAWMAHLQRRHIMVSRLNKAGTHPRMKDGSVTFFIAAEGGKYYVRAPHEHISQGALPAKIESLLITKRKELRYLMESSDWSVLPIHERVFAEALDDDIENFEAQVHQATFFLTKKFDKLRLKLTASVKDGSLIPVNGGVKNFIAAPSSDSSWSSFIRRDAE